MGNAFDAVAGELHRAAGDIHDAVGATNGMIWRDPSGDYGHDELRAAWQWFLDDVRSHVGELRAAAEEHGAGLTQSAATYLGTDHEVGGSFGDIAARLTAGRGR